MKKKILKPSAYIRNTQEFSRISGFEEARSEESKFLAFLHIHIYIYLYKYIYTFLYFLSF
jgi:hypothetical protein